MAVSESISSGMGWNKRVRKGRKENRGVEEDDGGVPGWSAEHPSHLLPTSLVSSSVLANMFPPSAHLLLLQQKKKKEVFLVLSFSALSCFPLRFFIISTDVLPFYPVHLESKALDVGKYTFVSVFCLLSTGL